MLKERKSCAEELVRKLKKAKAGENIDYVNPDNNIKKGFVIINYRKRELEEKIWMGGKLCMPAPVTWQFQGKTEGGKYWYGDSGESERLELELLAASQREILSLEQEFKRLKEMFPDAGLELMQHAGQGGRMIYLARHADGRDGCYYLFMMKFGLGILFGNFRCHRYRKKVWNCILPQLAGEIRER